MPINQLVNSSSVGFSAPTHALPSAVAANQVLAKGEAKDADTQDSNAFAPLAEVEAAANVAGRSVDDDKAVAAGHAEDAEQAQNQPLEAQEDKQLAEDKQQEKEQQEQKQLERQQQADLEIVRQLKSRDQEVKTHEQAHAAVGGAYAGSPSYTYERGPDGVRYAVAGEVSIDVGAIEGDPQATIEKMDQVQRAALAPAEPSGADRQVAAKAAQQEAQAVAELTQLQREQQQLEQAQQLAERQDAQEYQSQNADELAQAGASAIGDEPVLVDTAEQADEDNSAATSLGQFEPVSPAQDFARFNARARQVNEILLGLTVAPAQGQSVNIHI